MLISHAADQGFLGHRVPADDEGRILIHQFAQSCGNFVFIPLLLGRDGPAVHGQRIFDGRKLHRFLLGTEGISGHGELEAGNDPDIPGHNLFHGQRILASKGVDIPHFFHFIPAGIVYSAVGLDDAGEHPDKAHPPHKRIGSGLEHKGSQRSIGVPPFHLTGLQVGHMVFVQDSRESVVHNSGEGPAQADVLESRTAEHREDDALPDALHQTVHHFFIGNGLPFQIPFHHLIIGFHRRFHHFVMGILDPSLQVFRDFDLVRSVPVALIGFLVEHIDDPTEILFLPQRQFQGQDPFADLGPEIVQDIVVIGVFPVHLVHEDQTGQTGFLRQFPALFRSDLDPAGSTDHDQHAVHGPESPFDLRHEIGKARGINEIDLHIPPFHGSQGSAHRDSPLDFFRFEVRGGLPIFHLAHTADGTAAVEQCFRKGSGPCTSMPNNCHVPDFIACILFHCTAFIP